MTEPLESKFKKQATKKLNSTPELYFFVKEALALRGIPDIIGCYKGRFFAWELKRSAKEARKKTGRIVLQKIIIGYIRKAGGIAEIVHPDNFEEKYRELTATTRT